MDGDATQGGAPGTWSVADASALGASARRQVPRCGRSESGQPEDGDLPLGERPRRSDRAVRRSAGRGLSAQPGRDGAGSGGARVVPRSQAARVSKPRPPVSRVRGADGRLIATYTKADNVLGPRHVL